MKKKSLFKRGLVLALSLSMILPQNTMNLMAAETEGTEIVETNAEETASAESVKDNAVEEVQTPVAAEADEQEDETGTTGEDHYYLDDDGNRCDSLADIPCCSFYTEVYVYEDGTTHEATGYKYHMYTITYTDEQGNELVDFDPYSDDVPCGTVFTEIQVCETCGNTESYTYTKNHYTDTGYTYTAEDGTTYTSYSDIPCATTYAESYVCANCGETITQEYTYTKRHSASSYTYTGEDGTVYSSYSEIPCATNYTYSYVCTNCGETITSEDTYNKSHVASSYFYTAGDGNTYTDYSDIPCETKYSYSFVCSVCGETITRGYTYTKNHIASEYIYTAADGTVYTDYDDIPCQTKYIESYVCSTCGETISYDDAFTKDHEPSSDYTYTAADGTVYTDYEAIPCGTSYRESYVCDVCGETITEKYPYTKDHWLLDSVYIDAEGNEYTSRTDIPCDTYYTETGICEFCEETVATEGYVGHRYTQWEYRGTDGTAYDNYSDIPCQTYYIETTTCSKCGEERTYNGFKDHYSDEAVYTDAEGNEYSYWSEIPCETSFTKSGICKYCGEEYEDPDNYKYHYISYPAYTDAEGNEYTSFDELPCAVSYTESGICEYCGQNVEESGRSYHSYDTVYTTSDGTDYDSWADIPCGVYYLETMTCEKCGITAQNYGQKYHNGTVTYTAADGTVYPAYSAIPCETEVTESYTCDYCGEEISEIFYTGHSSNSQIITGADGTEYDSYDDLPCGTRYTTTYTCSKCGETLSYSGITNHGSYDLYYITEDHAAPVYTLEDGTEISGFRDTWPSCQMITETDVCTTCGRMYSEVIDTHDWVDTGNRGMVCSICGDYWSDVYNTEGLIYRQTDTVTAKEGQMVLLSVYSWNYNNDYQWQYSTDGGKTWIDCEDSLNDSDYSFVMDPSYDGRLYRCIVTDDEETEISASMSLTLKESIKITSQPANQTVVVGNSFSFKVAATGCGITYLWQYSTDGGETWTDTTRTKNNYGTKATNALNGRMFRCVITDEDGDVVISDPATLTVKPAISITVQPSSVTVNAGEKYSIKVTAKSNTGSKLTYLWQYSKTLKGWTDTTRTINNYGTYATVGVDGKYFRCKITDEAGNVVYSEPAMVRVLSDITITSQPTDTTVANGKRYYFTVTATGANLTYKWEYSKDGGNTWIETTRTKNNYTTYAKKAMNGWMFRCVITDSSNNTVTTEAGTLTVN